MVLITDLSVHFDFVSQFNTTLKTNPDKLAPKFRLLVLKMALKSADVGHAAKELSLHKKWSDRVTEEFYRQGDEERKRNIPISPFMDRQKPNVPKAQLGFIEYICAPMYDTWITFLNLSEEKLPCSQRLRVNRDFWKNESAINPEPPTPSANTTSPNANANSSTSTISTNSPTSSSTAVSTEATSNSGSSNASGPASSSPSPFQSQPSS